MTINIRTAQKKDIPFLAWVMWTAARSHLAKCPWSVIFDEAEAETCTLLEFMTQIPYLQWSYLTNFKIAEVDGTAAAAMCGFVPVTKSNVPVVSELDVLKQECNYSAQQLAEISGRLAIAPLGFPSDLAGAWAIENVAVLPAFRGQGLIDELFKHGFNQAQEKGFKQVQIFSLLGNEIGQLAFERNGFQVVSEKTNAEFNKLFGTPGAKLLIRDLDI